MKKQGKSKRKAPQNTCAKRRDLIFNTALKNLLSRGEASYDPKTKKYSLTPKGAEVQRAADLQRQRGET